MKKDTHGMNSGFRVHLILNGGDLDYILSRLAASYITGPSI